MRAPSACMRGKACITSAYVSVRQRTSSYVSIRHTPPHACPYRHTCGLMRAPSACMRGKGQSTRQHTSAFVSIRHTPQPACVVRARRLLYSALLSFTQLYSAFLLRYPTACMLLPLTLTLLSFTQLYSALLSFLLLPLLVNP
jgi:hypothetical protein